MGLTLFLLIGACAAMAAPAADAPSQAQLAEMHRVTGQTMDRLYADAGRKVDLALYDFEEMDRQKRSVPGSLLRRARNADRAIRARWLSLEGRRAALNDRRRALPPDEAHAVRIENLEVAAGDAAWFGLRSARLEWGSGAAVPFAPKDFRGGAQRAEYSYLVEPSAAAFIYGQGSGQDAMTAGFDMPEGARDDAALIVSGLDDDKPGRTRIRIVVDDAEVFNGENPFPPDAWGEHRFAIPASAFRSESVGRAEAVRLRDDLAALQRDVEAFGAWAARLADEVERATAKARAGLAYQPMAVAPDFWREGFLRGVTHVPFEQDTDHLFKSFRHLGANLLYSYTGLYNPPAMVGPTIAKARALGFPYVQFTYGLHNEERDRIYLGDPEKMLASAREFMRRVAESAGTPVNLAVDEPNFRDAYATDPDVLRAFRAYMEIRRPALARAGIAVPENPTPIVKMASEADRPLWMEWQMFKTEHMGENYRRLWEGLQADGIYPFVIVQDHRSDHPQQASHVTMGRALPLISTDLYSNATVREALVMDLVRNAASGRAILTAGAGYSDKTPDRFRRSLAVGLTHADGVLQWTDIYFDKYRDPRAFWQSGLDDMNRDILTNWHPDYWGIMEEQYARMEQADRYLAGTSSLAPVAVLFSERTAISDSADLGAPYVNRVQAVYSDLLRRGRPLDAYYVEALTPKTLAQYRALVLPDARVLTDPEIGLLRAWVRAGGTLITVGPSTLADEWGRPRADFALADVFGVRYAGDEDKGTAYTMLGRSVSYDPDARYMRVHLLPGAEAVGVWDSGAPAVVRNAYGRGVSYLFTGRAHFARVKGMNAGSGLYGTGDPAEQAILTRLVDEAAGEPAIRLENAPDGLEMQVRRTDDGQTVLHFTDWMDGRTVKGLRLRVNRPGPGRAFYPAGPRDERAFTGPQTITIRPFRIHEMLILSD